jgi:hypothetical protein
MTLIYFYVENCIINKIKIQYITIQKKLHVNYLTTTT